MNKYLKQAADVVKREAKQFLIREAREAIRSYGRRQLKEAWERHNTTDYTVMEVSSINQASRITGFLFAHSRKPGNCDRYVLKDMNAFSALGEGYGEDYLISPKPSTQSELKFEYEGKTVWVSRDSYPASNKDGKIVKVPDDSIHVKADADRAFFERLWEDVRDFYKRENAAAIYTNFGGEWREVDHEVDYKMKHVILEGDVGERLLQDLKKFRSRREFYEKHRIPYRRGYLLYGPPGTGKSSIARAFAGETGMDLYELSMTSGRFSDADLRDLINQTTPDSVILLEDIDRVLDGREQTADSDVTFSGLTNCLDGVSAQEGRVVVMTTNCPERLDDALLRKGRADVKQEIGLAARGQLRGLFNKFYERPDLADEFAQKLPEHQLSPAEVQSYFQEHMGQAEQAVMYAEQLIN